MAELFKNCREKNLQKTFLDAFTQSDAAEKSLLNERFKFQISNLQLFIIFF